MRLFAAFLPVLAFAAGCARAADEPFLPGDGGSTTDGNVIKPDGSPVKDSGTPDVEPGCKTVAPSNNCGLDPQCGCGAGTCDVDTNALNGSTLCVNAGSGQTGSPCTNTGDCAKGLTCAFRGVCRPYCSTDGADCGKANTSKCVQLQNGQSNPIPNFLVCRVNCTLDDTTSCGGSGRGCIYVDTDVTDCFDVSQYGTATCSQNDPMCGPGYVCLTNNQCAKWCNINSPKCTGNTTCQMLQNPPTVNGKTYGVCL